MEPSRQDLESLISEKYHGNKDAPGLAEDVRRLSQGEPLAYVIGHIPFLGVTVHLDSHPLIPRPETEWWTEELMDQIGTHRVSVLDVCAGSGAIGLALLKHCPQAQVSFGELQSSHEATIRKNIDVNHLEASRADVRIGDLFAPFERQRFDYIAINPPYIPASRTLEAGVTQFEPAEALFSGDDGLDVIRRIIEEAKHHLTETGELWMECDIENIHEANALLLQKGYTPTIRTDQYGRERLIVAHL